MSSPYPEIVYGLTNNNISFIPVGYTPASLEWSNDLPGGVSINATTGAISGIPTNDFYGNILITDEANTYEITLNIMSFHYSAEYKYQLYSETVFYPHVTGGAGIWNYHDFQISPALPDNLVLIDNGEIQGTPIDIIDTTFTVSLKAGDETQFTISSFRIYGFSLTYPNIYGTLGTPMSIAPVIEGNADATSFIINIEEGPDLSAGLTIDNFTGVISGTPTELISPIRIVIQFSDGDSANYNTYTCLGISLGECLRGDAKILTLKGYVPIGNLKDGDYVITDKHIVKKIKKLHYMDYSDSLYLMPQKFMKHQFPLNDLYMTKNHKFKYNNKWFKPSSCLKEIKQTETQKVYHIELDDQSNNIIAEGVVVESYRS